MTVQRLGSFTEEVIARNPAAQYGQADADMRVTQGPTALLIIDMIDEFARPGCSPYWVVVPDADV